MKKYYVYDTTLRDGAQREGISFSVSDKIEIVTTGCLNDHIEGGWPGSNSKDIEFLPFKGFIFKTRHASLHTRHANKDVEADDNVKAPLEANTADNCRKKLIFM